MHSFGIDIRKGERMLSISRVKEAAIRPVISFIVLIAAFVLLPLVFPLYVSIDILIFCIFTLSFNLVFGHLGLVHFGQAMFLGISLYATALTLVHVYKGLLSLFVGIAVATLIAAAIGYILLRRFKFGTDSAYLALTTLAFGQMFYFLCLSPLKGITGGTDGFAVPVPDLRLPGIISISLRNPWNLYFFILVILLLCIFLMRRIVFSPFGRVIHAIRENEYRVSFLGYNTFRYKLAMFILSGTFAGVAGSLYSIRLTYAGPDNLHWLLSGEVVLMCIIGGKGTFYGPIIGAAIYILLKDYISALTSEWMGILAVIIILIVLFLPKGIWHAVESLFRAIATKSLSKRVR